MATTSVIASQLLKSVKIGSIVTSDILVLAVIFIIFFAYALFSKDRIISFILAFYPAAYLFKLFPYVNTLVVLSGDRAILINKIVIFLIFLIPTSIVVNRYIFSESFHRSTGMFRSGGYALAFVIEILIFYYSILSLAAIYAFSPAISSLFSTPDRIFWWSLAPLLIMSVF